MVQRAHHRENLLHGPGHGQIVHSIPCHGDRAHGIAWDPIDASLWSIDSNKRVIYKLNSVYGTDPGRRRVQRPRAARHDDLGRQLLDLRCGNAAGLYRPHAQEPMTDGRIAILTKDHGPWQLERYPLPDPEPGAILVRISYANVCGSDLHWWRGEGVIPEGGRTLGHEMTGRVVALGAGVETDSTGRPLHEGDRIIYNYFFPCGRCVACLRDMAECCPNKSRPGNGIAAQFPHFVAAFSEYYYLLPGHVCVKVPDELSDALVAPINCALAQVLQALDSGRFRQGDSLVVQGAGGLGLNMIAAARDMGAGQIIAIDSIPGPTPARARLRRRSHD